LEKHVAIPKPSGKSQHQEEKDDREVDGAEKVIKLEDGADESDSGPQGVHGRERKVKAAKKQPADADANGSDKKPGEEDGEDD